MLIAAFSFQCLSYSLNDVTCSVERTNRLSNTPKFGFLVIMQKGHSGALFIYLENEIRWPETKHILSRCIYLDGQEERS